MKQRKDYYVAITLVLLVVANFAWFCYALQSGDACFQAAQKRQLPYEFSVLGGCKYK